MKKKKIKIIMGTILVLCLVTFLSTNRSAAQEAEQEVMLKIDTVNFPGLSKILKDKEYDKNKDGYLSQTECQQISILRLKKISSLKGINHFPYLSFLYVEKFTGTNITLTKDNEKLQELFINTNRKKLTIDAPFVKVLQVQSISIQKDGSVSSGNMMNGNSALKTLDISKCQNIQKLSILQKKLSVLKMPKKNTNLKWICLEDLKIKSLNLQNYKNLAYIRLVSLANVKNLKLKKNTKVQGLELYSNMKLTKIDVSKSRKLKAIYLYCNNSRLKKNIKLPKGRKVKFTSNNIPLQKISSKV